MSDLNTLKAKELKVIATNAGLEFDARANAETMIALLEEAGITEIPVDTSSESEKEKVEGEYEVVDNLKYNGVFYAKGETIVIEEAAVLETLLANGTIK